jgi:hypothetical protein
MEARLEEAIKKAAVEKEGRMILPCAAAFQIAGETGATLAEIGAACNEHRIKIVRCQLGCF